MRNDIPSPKGILFDMDGVLPDLFDLEAAFTSTSPITKVYSQIK